MEWPERATLSLPCGISKQKSEFLIKVGVRRSLVLRRVYCGAGRDVSNVAVNAVPVPASIGLLGIGGLGLGLLLLKRRAIGYGAARRVKLSTAELRPFFQLDCSNWTARGIRLIPARRDRRGSHVGVLREGIVLFYKESLL